MVHFSTTDLNLIFLENIIDEPSCKLSDEDQAFYSTLKDELNKEIRNPHAVTIEAILEHSRKFSE